jgi:hypothetical protein
LVGPEVGDEVDVEEPGKTKEDGYAEESPEKKADGEGVRKRSGGPGFGAEEEAAGGANASGDNDAGDGGDEALLPGSGGEEEGGVNERVEGEDGEEKGERAAEIQKHGGTPHWIISQAEEGSLKPSAISHKPIA